MKRALILILCCSVLAYAQGNNFDRVRYNGGSVTSTVKPDDWDNRLTVTSDVITLTLKDGQKVSIQPKQVTSISYGQEAHRRVGTAVGLAVISLGVGALFALHKTKLHFIGVNYTDEQGKNEGILLQGDKSNFRAILVALQGVTGVPVSVGDKDREEIPAGIAVQAVKQAEPAQGVSSTAPLTTGTTPSSRPAETPELMSVTSNPDGADVYVDGSFVGNTPAKLKLTPGRHTISVKQVGYKEWSRDVSAESAAEAHVTATLEK